MHKNHGKYHTNYFKYLGLEDFVVYQEIFRPEESPPTILMSEWLNNNKRIYQNKDVCDLGCGSGIFSVLMAKNDVKKVFALDVEPLAIKNTKANAIKYKVVNKIVCLESDLFRAINGQSFDFVISNFPSIKYSNYNVKAYLGLFTNENTIKRLWGEVKKVIKPNGKIIIPSTYIKGVSTFNHKKFAEKSGFNCFKLIEDDFSYKRLKVKIELYQYSLVI